MPIPVGKFAGLTNKIDKGKVPLSRRMFSSAWKKPGTNIRQNKEKYTHSLQTYSIPTEAT